MAFAPKFVGDNRLLTTNNMNNLFRVLGTGIGWALGGPIGALVGYLASEFVGGITDAGEEGEGRKRFNKQQDQSGDFHLSLLILSAVVIKADGRADTKELDFVRSRFAQMFGKEKANKSFKLFKEVLNKDIDVADVSAQIRAHLNYSARLQILDYLFKIAQADGNIHVSEINVIRNIATHLYIRSLDFNSVFAMYGRRYSHRKTTSVSSTAANYAILEVSSKASDDEIKAAYRKLVRKYHPDKLQGLGQDVIDAGKEKFIRVQTAYEEICEVRKIK